MEEEMIEMRTFLGEQLGYKKPDDNKGYVGRLFRELFTHKTKTEATLDGNDTMMGIRTKVAIMWRTYMGLACATSAVIGFIAKDLFDKIF